jgi:hypothetical protein
LEYYSAFKKILPFAAAWMNLEDIDQAKQNQRKKNAV